jgi:hypothetical protein
MTKRDRKERASLGGRARALSLSPRRRREIAKAATRARWVKKADRA